MSNWELRFGQKGSTIFKTYKFNLIKKPKKLLKNSKVSTYYATINFELISH